MTVLIQKLNEGVDLPQYATTGSAGFDLAIDNFKTCYYRDKMLRYESETVESVLVPGSRILIGCGFKVAVPPAFEMQIRSRSGKALHDGLIVLNAPGTIDSDYRGEIGVILYNAGGTEINLKKGMKVAQGLITPVELAEWKLLATDQELTYTKRGEGGFGSTTQKGPGE